MEERSEAMAAQLTQQLGCEVVSRQKHLSENWHFQTAGGDAGALFVKVYACPERFAQEGLALQALVSSASWVIMSVEEGRLPLSGHNWRAFPYIRMRPFEFDSMGCRSGARLLAEVHCANIEGTRLPFKEHGWNLIAKRIRAISRWAPAHLMASAVARSAEPMLAELAKTGSSSSRTTLLTEDFGTRNIHRRQDDGSPVLIDFEHAAIGDPLWDLGKVWDQDLADPVKRDVFIAEYCERAEVSGWPNLKELWATRFAAALAIFPYASRVDDAEFFEHGLAKLEVLKGELPGLLG